MFVKMVHILVMSLLRMNDSWFLNLSWWPNWQHFSQHTLHSQWFFRLKSLSLPLYGSKMKISINDVVINIIQVEQNFKSPKVTKEHFMLNVLLIYSYCMCNIFLLYVHMCISKTSQKLDLSTL